MDADVNLIPNGTQVSWTGRNGIEQLGIVVGYEDDDLVIVMDEDDKEHTFNPEHLTTVE